MSAPFRKVLIANRGEIAVRVIRACREIGIATVAVYSDADRASLHVRIADEAVPIGPPPAAESYLVIDKLIAAARATGAEAIHPGYGFLSENADVRRACLDARAHLHRAVGRRDPRHGRKTAARRVAIEMGVPVVPGTEQPSRTTRRPRAWPQRIGYPVMVKAAAGGGGKGMRLVRTPERPGGRPARRALGGEAPRSATPRSTSRSYVERPRHIEIQILGDRTATWCTWASASARSSGGTRR